MGKEHHCRTLKPCILAVRSLPSFAGSVSAVTGPNQDYAIVKEMNDHDGSYVLGRVQWNKHEV
jgi:hypothetical protein